MMHFGRGFDGENAPRSALWAGVAWEIIAKRALSNGHTTLIAIHDLVHDVVGTIGGEIRMEVED